MLARPSVIDWCKMCAVYLWVGFCCSVQFEISSWSVANLDLLCPVGCHRVCFQGDVEKYIGKQMSYQIRLFSDSRCGLERQVLAKWLGLWHFPHVLQYAWHCFGGCLFSVFTTRNMRFPTGVLILGRWVFFNFPIFFFFFGSLFHVTAEIDISPFML